MFDHFLHGNPCKSVDVFLSALPLRGSKEKICWTNQQKINGYKQQDIDKKLLNNEKIINLKYIIDKLIETKVICYYCNCKMNILYENVRESKQWTVDRINNDLGHNIDNIVLACLDCNLKRRCKSADKFLFTKQLNIIRQDN